MQFTIHHDIDAPLDAIELAMMSPDLGPLMGHNFAALESVQAVEHEVADNTFSRVWRFQAKAPLKVLRAYDISRDMMSWEEHSSYTRATHCATWHVYPLGDTDPEAPWRRHFHASGRYQLTTLSGGRTRRTVSGELSVRLRLVGNVVERAAIKRLHDAYEAEANALRMLCTLP